MHTAVLSARARRRVRLLLADLIASLPAGLLAGAGLCFGFWAVAGAHAHAQAVPEAAYSTQALAWARDAAQAALPQHDGPALRLEVSVGQLDGRLRLAPCAAVDVYLPVGARLWGRSRLGMRCTDGQAHWNVSVPLTVKAYGPAWTVRAPVAAGQAVQDADLVQQTVDWAEEASAVLWDAAQWRGQVAALPLLPGHVLRQGMLRAPQVFAAGTQVRIVVEGNGFRISSAAEALSAGVVGQLARVRLEDGRVSTGTVLDARTVKMDL